MPSIVKTRIAPSPTGLLHLGTARTAYYNWLYATQNNGHFHIRIEDTDSSRNDYSCVDRLISDLKWLNISPNSVSYQSKNIHLHKKIAQTLLDTGHAYKCYMTPSEIEFQRTSFGKIVSPYRNKPGSGNAFTIRFKIPENKSWALEDSVCGNVCFTSDALDDCIIARSDGSPTYLLASMVDDYYEQITHVIRGDDHLTNTTRQIPIYQALGWNLPAYVHLPMVCDSQGKKFSKRDGAQSIEYFRKQGFLPEAVLNALLRIGWSSGDKELISQSEAVKLFNFQALSKSCGRFDINKLLHLNALYMRNINLDRLYKDWSSDDISRAKRIMPEVVKRSSTLNELNNNLQFVRSNFTSNGFSEICKDALVEALSSVEFTEQNLEQVLRQFAKDHKLNFGKHIAQPLRQALTGSNISPSLFLIMSVLGKSIVLQRIK